MVVAVLCLGLVAAPAATQELERDRLQVSFGFLVVPYRGSEAGTIEVEYRWADPLLWRARPRVGAAAYTDGSAYGYAGLFVPFAIAPRVTIEPGLAVGSFRADEIDLGSPLEFRSSIEVGVQLGYGQRLSLLLYHLSNAGLGYRNPGVEVLGVGYSIDL